MTIQQSLGALKLIQMRALTQNHLTEPHNIEFRGDGESIGIKNTFGSGWNFHASEYANHPAYQTLWWLKAFEAELNKPEWDFSNPEDIAIAVRAYKAERSKTKTPPPARQ
jgi:hypothetical protein